MKTQPRYKLTGSAIGLFFFGVIPPTLLGFLSWYAYPSWLWMLLVPFGTLWLVLCMIGFVRAIRVDPRDVQEAENLQKLKPLLEGGEQLVYESHVILDNTDRRALDRAFRRPLPALFIFVLVPGLVAVFVSYWVLLIWLLPLGLAVASWRSIEIMKRRNRKVILRGIVTGRPFHRGVESRDSQHYLQLGDKKIAVDADLYEKYIAGDIMELHYVGWLRGDEMTLNGAVFTQHRKLTPAEFQNWVQEFTA